MTLWRFVPIATDRAVDFRALGEVIARLHGLPLAELEPTMTLPFCGDADWLDVEGRIDRLQDLRAIPAPELAALRRASARISGWRELAGREAPVICHGDVHPQNVLMSTDGVVLIDWDSISYGPPAFDHAPLMTWSARWGGTPGAYTEFADGYQQDMRDTELGERLAELRLLAPTVNMIANGLTNPACAREARLRMRYWLGDPAAPSWTAV